jgi:uncharacterized integral membrane protein
MLVIIVLLALVATFAVQNPGIITVRFLHLSGNTSLLVVLVAAFGIGVVVGFLAGIPSAVRRKRRVRELEAELGARKKPVPSPTSSALP